ncbi:DNA metabolism protein [Flavobacterium magnum]|uniref:DNA metabolism protein n=1 Tax=Flavobacterium magnum TaxID=2162713 RepID=A0A2S0RF93_9FLAO|nr:TIGR03915 family putative DNA repair protein [Flavobacterium magnum]AWA30199.1 DNA metabolism protein [Flavobacterium magnum]
MTVFVFDGSLEGLLTAVFEFYETKPGAVKIVPQSHYQPGLLESAVDIFSDDAKAKRVWEGLGKKIGSDWQLRFYKSYLSEVPEMAQHLFDFCRYIFDNPKGAEQNYGHPSVMAISKMDRSVNRERHRMKAFIRFQETIDGMFYATVEPDYNVLPLIANFFKNRYADQQWIIYDLRRHYGLYYDLQSVSEITMSYTPELRKGDTDGLLHNKESLYAVLWQDYFKSTNIPARKNMKLHLQHVPRRYWKYLTEKQ